VVTNHNEKNLIKNICYKFSVLKLQKWFRSKISLDKICPITMTEVIYPYFAFRPKGARIFIYYNLEDLGNYLTKTGDFRDPKTREKYSDDNLKKIDIELKKNIIKLDGPFKTVFKASKNKKYYKNKKDTEDNILVLERILDDIIGSMRTIIEDRIRRSNAIVTLHNICFMTFRSYFRRLVAQSKESATFLIKRTIISINESIKYDSKVDPDTNMIRDNIILFLYQVRFDELGL